eukprot:3048177-Rhodomonas_salina.1
MASAESVSAAASTRIATLCIFAVSAGSPAPLVDERTPRFMPDRLGSADARGTRAALCSSSPLLVPAPLFSPAIILSSSISSSSPTPPSASAPSWLCSHGSNSSTVSFPADEMVTATRPSIRNSGRTWTAIRCRPSSSITPPVLDRGITSPTPSSSSSSTPAPSPS